jgi:hypothetical protein
MGQKTTIALTGEEAERLASFITGKPRAAYDLRVRQPRPANDGANMQINRHLAWSRQGF